jgi:ATP-dependent exoDNAse (exonuclease V) beta subunit
VSAPRRPPVDQAVRDGAAARLDESFLLEAGAGTGKTTVLLSRVVEIVKTHVPLDKIAVITFTEKAAGELKLRLREELERMLHESARTAWGDVLRQSLEALDRATVCTIHAFSASLLRERPVEAGVDPRFSVADGLATSILMEETWERWLDREMAAGAAPLGRALRGGVTLPQIRRLAFDLTDNRDVAPGPPPARPGALQKVRERVLEEIGKLLDLSAACVEESDAGFGQLRALDAAATRLREAPREELLARLAALPLKSHLGSQKNWSPPGRLAEIKTILGELATLRDEAVRATRSAFTHEIAAWIRGGYFQAYRSAKESRRLLDFTDILVICRNMLRDSRAARIAFQQRFDCLLVDEFQDTDPLQSEILFLLAADDPGVADWRKARPKPGKLFVVGDPKQSIYRFRRADIEIYEDARGRIAGAGGVTNQSLTQNFRTVPSIVSWINDLFRFLIPDSAAPAPYQPAYKPIAADRDEPERDLSRVLLLVPASSLDPAGAAVTEVRKAEARHVVALIRAAVDGAWPVVDRGAGGPRPMRWRDITLLFRTGTALEIYEEALRARGVPYRITGGRRYYMRAETRALQAVLAAIESPFDPLAVVSALRSPFFGHSDEELLARVASGGDWVYTRDRAGAGTPFEKAFELLARLHTGRNLRPLAATLEDLYESSGALALFYLKSDGDQRAANMLKAVDLARAHEQTAGAAFGSYVRWLERMAEEEREEGEAPLTEETESEPDRDGAAGDAVRMLTVHKAKGLEFPMVILCDSAGRPRADSPGCVVERGGDGARVEFRLGTKESGFESAGYRDAAEREESRLKAEAIRLFYVATTRARDYLVIPAFAGARPAGFHAMLKGAGFLPEAGPDQTRSGASARLHRGARLLDGATLDLEARAAHPYRLPVQELEASDPSLSIEKEAWRRGLDLVLKAPATGRAFRSASAMERIQSSAAAPGGPGTEMSRQAALGIGRAAHGVLERIDLATGRDIGVLCEEEAAASGHPESAGEVRALVEKALKSRIVKEALAAPRLYRELPISAAGESFITEDRIDLVFEAGGALTIVDFKTDQVNSDEEITARLEAYRPQALIYARALSQVAGIPVARVVFLFIRPGAERVLAVDEAFLMMGRRLLETGSSQTTP